MRNSPTEVGQAYDVKRATSSAGLRTIDDLPLFEELVPLFEDPGENVDFNAILPIAFERYSEGFLRSPEGGIVVLRNRDLGRLAAHPDVGNTPPERIGDRLREANGPWENGFEELFGSDIFTMNPPVHRPVRKQVARPLLKSPVAELTPLAEAVVESVMEEALERDEIDFLLDFAGLVCARFWTGFLKMDPAVGHHLKELEEDALPALRLPADRDIAEGEAGNRASKEFLDLVAKEIDRGIAAGDLPSFAKADEAFQEIPGERCPWADRKPPTDITLQNWMPETYGYVFGSMVYDGYHTASLLFNNMVRTLLDRPEVMQQLREDPDLIPAAVDEAGRLDGAVIATNRFTLADLEYKGVFIPKETQVRMMWWAGNRDPEVYENPTEFRFDRPITEQTTFGGGGHICLGRHVGRLLGESIVRALTAPGVEIVSNGPSPWIRSASLRQVVEMPVSISRH